MPQRNYISRPVFYVVFTDAELALFAQAGTFDEKKILQIEGIGKKRMEKYGMTLRKCGRAAFNILLNVLSMKWKHYAVAGLQENLSNISLVLDKIVCFLSNTDNKVDKKNYICGELNYQAP